MANRITSVEVGPRDGLQAEQPALSPPVRVELIGRLAAAGARRIEVASFVDPRRVPQMAGAEEVCASLPSPRRWSAIGLVLNARGLERALAAALDEVNIVAYASDGYSRINTETPSGARNQVAAELAAAARETALRVTVTIAVAFGDPVEGDVPVGRVSALAAAMAEAGAHEINLGDTIGVAVPELVASTIAEVRGAAPGTALRCHFHDTNRTGYANVYAAIAAGVDAIDASVGGHGGSPLHPDAGGNVATEHLAWMLGRSGFDTGLDRGRLVETDRWLSTRLGAAQPSS
jgi:hydroxymethylglutaryl-CoA lyase